MPRLASTALVLVLLGATTVAFAGAAALGLWLIAGRVRRRRRFAGRAVEPAPSAGSQ